MSLKKTLINAATVYFSKVVYQINLVLEDNYRELVEHNYLYHITKVNSTFQFLPIYLSKLPSSES